jgi:hypothetical protein
MSFSKTGVFTNTGLLTVTLIGNSTPSTTGINNLIVGGTTGCNFSINILVGTTTTTSGVYIAGNDGGNANVCKNNMPTTLSTDGPQASLYL